MSFSIENAEEEAKFLLCVHASVGPHKYRRMGRRKLRRYHEEVVEQILNWSDLSDLPIEEVIEGAMKAVGESRGKKVAWREDGFERTKPRLKRSLLRALRNFSRK